MVIILAAGKGTRFGLPEGVSKCSVKLNNEYHESTVARLIRQFYRINDEKRFTLVVGYGHDTVINSVKDNRKYYEDAQIDIIINNNYDKYACGYSLYLSCDSVGRLSLFSCQQIYIAEGDSVYSDECIRLICDTPRSCCLVRDPSFINTSSVVVTTDKETGRVINFLYDPNHQINYNNYKTMIDCTGTQSVHESMQLWKIVKNTYGFYKCLMKLIGHENFATLTDLYPLMQYISSVSDIFIVPVSHQNGNTYQSWVNLNSSKLLEIASKL